MADPHRILPMVVVLALIVCGTSPAGEPEEFPEDDSGSTIVAEGKSDQGYLHDVWVAPSWDHEAFAPRFEEYDVLLLEYLPYPNPLSSPAAIVTVGRQTDFILEVKDVSSGESDEFVFTNVEPGFYRFYLEGSYPYEERFIVTLWSVGDKVEEISYRQSALSRGW